MKRKQGDQGKCSEEDHPFVGEEKRATDRGIWNWLLCCVFPCHYFFATSPSHPLNGNPAIDDQAVLSHFNVLIIHQVCHLFQCENKVE